MVRAREGNLRAREESEPRASPFSFCKISNYPMVAGNSACHYREGECKRRATAAAAARTEVV